MKLPAGGAGANKSVSFAYRTKWKTLKSIFRKLAAEKNFNLE